MKTYLTSVTALCLATGAAHAGALDRTGQSVDVLFETGRYGEFSFATVSPNLSGVATAPFSNGTGSGDIAPSYQQFSGAYKADINEKFSYALIIDQPFDADVAYPGGTGYFGQNSSAAFDAVALTGLLQYNTGNGFSVYGGLRLQSVEADADIQLAVAPAINYQADASRDYGVGYVAGIAYERPEIALRVSLTYNSEISHEVDTVETDSLLGSLNSVTALETPQSVNLAFQSGIAADTLIFGSVRWVDWSDFELTPSLFQTRTAGASILRYEDDVTTYTLGLGRKLNETWSIAASLGYERTTGSFFTNLGPSDGQRSLGLAAIYKQDKMTITTGVRYIEIGDTLTSLSGAEAAQFKGNDAIALGVKVGYHF